MTALLLFGGALTTPLTPLSAREEGKLKTSSHVANLKRWDSKRLTTKSRN